jgi:CheY-like chemotaxis protein
MSYHTLVVDDEKITTAAMTDLLSFLGHKVSIANNLSMAIVQFLLTVPDIVFLDLHLADCNGLEICRYIRRDPHTAHIPIIITSADDQAFQQQRAFMAGANYYLFKPVMLHDLEQVLEKASQLLLLGKIGTIKSPSPFKVITEVKRQAAKYQR